MVRGAHRVIVTTTTKSGSVRPAEEAKASLRMGYPAALNWILLAYAVITVAAGCAYAASRIHADYEAPHSRPSATACAA